MRKTKGLILSAALLLVLAPCQAYAGDEEAEFTAEEVEWESTETEEPVEFSSEPEAAGEGQTETEEFRDAEDVEAAGDTLLEASYDEYLLDEETQFRYKILPDGTAEVAGYYGTPSYKDLIIPDTIAGYTVTSIEDGAFRGVICSGELQLPKGLLSIGIGAFSGCNELTGSLELPNGLTSIGENAFGGCDGFTGDLIIPDSVTSIGSGAFAYCSGFSGKLKLSNGLTSIAGKYGTNGYGTGTFTGCSGFKGDLIIPSNVTSIGAHAFEECGFDGTLVLPDGLTYIDYYAFAHCSNLKGELKIPDNVTNIGTAAFSHCSGFTGQLKLPAKLVNLGGDLPMDWDSSNGAFTMCTGLSGNLIIPENVTIIGDHAFSYCTGLEGTLTLSKGLSSIGQYAFYKSEGLTGNLLLPDNLTFIGHSAFEDCNGFTGTLSIPSKMETIGSYAFNNCYGFSRLNLSDGKPEIGEKAFNNCSFIGDLEIPEGTTDIGPYSFSNCRFSGELKLPDTLTSIDEYAFSDCSFSGELELPHGLTKLGEGAFENNYFTGNLEIPGSLHIIGDGAFYDSHFSKDLTIHEGVKQIGASSFHGCEFEGQLKLPSGLTRIGESAFTYCRFNGELKLPEGLLRIDRGAFNYCSGFSGDLVIPKSVTTVVNYAFDGTRFSRINNLSNAEILLPGDTNWYSLANHSPFEDGILGNGIADNVGFISVTVEGDYTYLDDMTDYFVEMNVGGKLRLSASIDKLEDENIKYTWSVNDETIAKLDESGTLTALRPGEVEVYVTAWKNCDMILFITVNESSGVPTVSPTPTTSPEVSPSVSPSASPTVTPQQKPTASPEQTPTGTPEQTPTGTPEQTPSVTPETSPGVTPEATPSVSPEATPSVTPGTTPSATPEMTPSVTPEATPTAVPEPTPSQAPTLTPGPVTSPDGITAEPSLGSKKVELSWEPVPDADGYVVYVKDEKTGEFKKVKTLRGSDSTSFSKNMGKLGGAYTFKIQSYKKSEDGQNVYTDLGDEISVRLYEYNKSKKPDVQASTKTGSKRVFFQWEKVPGADGYLIYRYNTATKKYELLDTISGEDTTSYDFEKSLKNGETYSFRVRAFAKTEDGKTQVNGKISATVKVTTPPVKAKKPTAVSTVKNEAQLSWPKVSNAKGYRIYRSTSKNGKYTTVETTSGNDLSFTDKNLKSGKVYYYKIRAYSENPDGTKVFGQISAARKVKVK